MSKKITKLTIFSLLVLTSILFGTMFASGATIAVADGVVFVKPLTGQTMSGLTQINVTNSTTFYDWINCSFYLKSVGLTANTTWTPIGNVKNNTKSITNFSYNTANKFEDGNDYYLNATCFNTSVDIGYAIITITIDNTIPTTPTTLSPASNTLITSTTAQTFTGTLVNTSTTSCSYTIARGGADSGNDYTSASGTFTGTGCSFSKTFTDTLDNGLWYWTLIASDETNTSRTASQILNVQIPPTGGNICVSTGGQNGDNGCVCQSGYVYTEDGCVTSACANDPTQCNVPPANTSYVFWVVLVVVIVILVILFKRR